MIVSPRPSGIIFPASRAQSVFTPIVAETGGGVTPGGGEPSLTEEQLCVLALRTRRKIRPGGLIRGGIAVYPDR